MAITLNMPLKFNLSDPSIAEAFGAQMKECIERDCKKHSIVKRFLEEEYTAMAHWEFENYLWFWPTP